MANDMLNALVVDDEPDAIEVLSDLLNDSGKVSEIHSIQESHKVECTIQKVNPDVVFLDIEMPGIDGISILENIREYDQELAVVYVTAYEKYIPEAIKLNVYSYLLKPPDRQELSNMLEKLLEKKLNGKISKGNQKIKLPVKDGYIYLNKDEIFLLEADGNYTFIITIDQQKYLSSYNMGRIARRIPGDQLLRINRKNFLNGQYLVHINKKALKCTAKIDEREFEFEISKSFVTQFNKEVF